MAAISNVQIVNYGAPYGIIYDTDEITLRLLGFKEVTHGVKPESCSKSDVHIAVSTAHSILIERLGISYPLLERTYWGNQTITHLISVLNDMNAVIDKSYSAPNEKEATVTKEHVDLKQTVTKVNEIGLKDIECGVKPRRNSAAALVLAIQKAQLDIKGRIETHSFRARLVDHGRPNMKKRYQILEQRAHAILANKLKPSMEMTDFVELLNSCNELIRDIIKELRLITEW